MEVENCWSFKSWTLMLLSHVFRERIFFEALKLVEGGFVHLEDGKACKVQGMSESLLHDAMYFLDCFDA